MKWLRWKTVLYRVSGFVLSTDRRPDRQIHSTALSVCSNRRGRGWLMDKATHKCVKGSNMHMSRSGV